MCFLLNSGVCVCVCLHFSVSLWARQELQMDMQGLANCCTKIFLDCRCSCEERPSEKDGFGTCTLCSCTTESKQSDDWVVPRGRFTVLNTLRGSRELCQQPSCISDNTLAVCAPGSREGHSSAHTGCAATNRYLSPLKSCCKNMFHLITPFVTRRESLALCLHRFTC